MSDANPTVPSPSFMAEHGPRLLTGGYNIIPIAPREKWPGRFDRGAWTSLEWDRYKVSPATASIVRMWSGWPECGVGIICGQVVAIDIDIDDEDLVAMAYGVFNKHLGATPCVRIGSPLRKLLVYRTETPFKKIKNGPVEVLADGQQFVAYGIHPKGHEYRWVGDGLHDVLQEELPLVDKGMVSAAVDEVFRRLPDDFKKGRLTQEPQERPTGTGGASTSIYGQKGTPEAVAEALQFIPNNDLHWDDWNRVGMAIFAALGPSGYGLFEEWSYRAPKAAAGRDTPKARWASYTRSPPREIGAGTIYHLAGDNGWSPSTGLDLHPITAPPVDFSALLRSPAPAPAAAPENPLDETPEWEEAEEEQGSAHSVGMSPQLSSPSRQTVPKSLPLLSGDELLQRRYLPRKWLIDGWIPDHQVTVLSGEGGTGKSLLALQLAVAAATGGLWLGHNVSQRRVVYVAAEDDEDEIGRRLSEISANPRPGELSGLQIAPMAGLDATLARFVKGKELTLTPVQNALAEACTAFTPGLLVLDTSADLFGGDENDRQQVRSFMTMLRGLALKFRMAVLLLSHPSVSAMTSGRATSGSTAWANSARAVLLLEHVVYSDDGRPYVPDPDIRRLSLHKSNYSGKGAMKMLRRFGSGFDNDNTVKVANDLPRADDKFMELVDLLNNQGHELSPSPTSPSSYAPAIFVAHERSGGFTKRAFKEAMQRLLANNVLTIVQEGPASKPRRRLVRKMPSSGGILSGSEPDFGSAPTGLPVTFG